MASSLMIVCITLKATSIQKSIPHLNYLWFKKLSARIIKKTIKLF